MSIVDKTVPFADEIDDVMICLRDLVEDLKAGKDLGEVAKENLPNLMTAIEGAQSIPDEVKENRRACLGTAGYRGAEIGDILLG